MSFSVRCLHSDGETLVRVRGEVDIDTAPRLRKALQTAVDTGEPIVVDLIEVTFMDSAGFGALVAAHQQAQAAGTHLRLRGVSARIRQLLGLLGLDAVLTVEPTSGCLAH